MTVDISKPKTEAHSRLTPELLKSAALRSLPLSALRIFHWLLAENAEHAGKKNGWLVAPRDQVGNAPLRHQKAVDLLQKSGLADVMLGTGKRPHRYTLTMYASYSEDEKFATAATHRWRAYCSESEQLRVVLKENNEGF